MTCEPKCHAYGIGCACRPAANQIGIVPPPGYEPPVMAFDKTKPQEAGMSEQTEGAEVLRGEVEWLERSLANAREMCQYSDEYLKGYEAAISWVRLHAEHPHLIADRVAARGAEGGGEDE